MGKDLVISRRTAVGGALVAGASVLAVGQAGLPSTVALAQEEPAIAEGADASAQYGFLIKVKNCVDCGECVKACRLWSRTPESVDARRKVERYTLKTGKEAYVSTSCMHCTVPACASVCPAGAISKGPGGVVRVDKDRCIGCKYCFQACPYGVPRYTSAGIDKCDCCVGNGVALGEVPHCVRACKVGALSYGKIDDLMAQTKGKARYVSGTTGPAYLLL